MKKTALIVLASLIGTSAVFAQEAKKYPEPEGMRPGMSEYWTPQPKVVKFGRAHV